jgi:tetratricopeptide (TPR) repeat protein
MIFDIHDSIQDLPGSTAARKLVVEKGVEYLDKLAQESRGDASLQREVAAGYERIGDAQGNSLAANLGDTAGALASYRKALALREAVFVSRGSTDADAVALAKSLRLIANAFLLTGNTADAVRNSRLAVSTAEQAAVTHPHDISILDELRQDYSVEANILAGNFNASTLGDVTGALDVRRREVEVAQHISDLEPGSLAAEEKVARAITHLGDQLSMVGRRQAALDQYLRAQPMFEDLSKRAPGPKRLNALQSIYNRLYFAQYSQGAKAAALASIRRAQEMATELGRTDPNDFRARMLILGNDVNLATVLLGMNDINAAAAASNESLSLLSDLEARNPDNGEIPDTKVSVMLTAADISAKSGDTAKAQRYLRESIDTLARAQARNADDATARIDLAQAQNALGKVLTQTREFDAATDMHRKALALADPLWKSGHPSEETLYTMAETYAGLGMAEESRATIPQTTDSRTAHLNQALSWYTQSLHMWGQIKEPALLSPAGFECIQPDVIRQHIDAVNRSLLH